MDTFYNDVINELREKKYSEGYVWVFNQYNIFRSELTPQLSLQDFFSEMDKLCDQGFFIKNMPFPLCRVLSLPKRGKICFIEAIVEY